MFWNKNKKQAENFSVPEDLVDPKNIHVLMGSSLQKIREEQSAKASDSFRVELEKKDQDFVQRNFSVEKDRLVKEKDPIIAEDSPFFSIKKDMPKDPFKESPSPYEEEEGATLKQEDLVIGNKDETLPGFPKNNFVMGDYLRSQTSHPASVEIIKEKFPWRLVRLGTYLFIVLFLLSFIAWGGYSYWKYRSASTSQKELSIIIDEPLSNENKVTFPYDWEIANAIVVNEKSGKKPLAEIKKVSEELSRYEGNGVLEFYFVDEGRNFETISSFELVDILGITVPKSIKILLKETGEGRVYLTKRGSDVRVVLSLETTSRDSALGGFLFFEPEIIGGFSSLYLDETFKKVVKPVFRDQVYREYAIRYYNIDVDRNISLDYAFRRDTLFVSSSKDSIRDVLDRLDGKSTNS